MEAHNVSYLWLLPTIKYKLEGLDLLFYNENGAIRIGGLGKIGVAFINKLNGTVKEPDLLEDPVSAIILPILKNEGWLVHLKREINSVIGERVWLSRQLSYYAHLTQDYPDKIIDDLAQATVLIIGAGGVGSNIAYSLAAAGIGNIVITDRDHVEESNINRQFLYSKQEIGMEKALVVAQKLRERFEPINVEGIVVDFDEGPPPAALPPSDMIVVCGEVNAILDYPSLVDGKPLLLAGYVGSKGVVGPLISTKHETPCFACVMAHVRRSEIKKIVLNEGTRTNSWNSSASTINGVVGQMAAEVAMRTLTDALSPTLCLNETLLIDMQTLNVNREPVQLASCEHSQTLN